MFDLDFSFGQESKKREKQKLEQTNESIDTVKSDQTITNFMFDLSFDLSQTSNEQTNNTSNITNLFDFDFTIRQKDIQVDLSVNEITNTTIEKNNKKDKNTKTKDLNTSIVDIDFTLNKNNARIKQLQAERKQIYEQYKEHFNNIAQLIKILDDYMIRHNNKRHSIYQKIGKIGYFVLIYAPKNEVAIERNTEIDIDTQHILIHPLSKQFVLLTVSKKIDTAQLNDYIKHNYKQNIQIRIMIADTYEEHEQIVQKLVENINTDNDLIRLYASGKGHPLNCVLELMIDKNTKTLSKESSFDLSL